ncbi:hypothetical protein RRG08_056989 [Elysia crispata]|uniref:Coiled-coil-helix-coiled-coil-helix domain-containing protein 7 n=1 Tax=Elysia crispata TaxID=231223 RepID=A0AAE0Z6E5_9GAST|nr:hypothetical protein RRG08_056989 [Elysia crispata]
MSDNAQKHRFSDNRHKKSAYEAAMHLKNPCVKEHQMTMQCLEETGYDRAQCDKFYENYRNCKKFWSWITAERKRKGIKPYLPDPDDRDAVKQEYIHLMKQV